MSGEVGMHILLTNDDALLAPGIRALGDPDYDVVRVEQGYATLTKLTWDFRLNAGDSDMNEIDL